MPSWVKNSITFRSVEARDRFLNLAVPIHKPNTFDFNWFIPAPETKKDCPDKFIIDETDAHLERIPGKEWFNWLDWNVCSWGTKWPASMVSYDGPVITFETAWSPPEPVFRRMYEIGGGLIEKILYVDESPNFAGEFCSDILTCSDFVSIDDIYNTYNALWGQTWTKDPETGDWDLNDE